MLKPIDLSLPIEEGMLVYSRPWHVHVQIEQLATIGRQGRETRRFVLGSHTGTHIDAPRHFLEGGAGIDAIPLEILVGRARLLDLTALPSLTAITEDLLRQALGDNIPSRLILRYDWDRYWGKADYYNGHPFLTDAAAAWLVAGGLRLLGMDTPMPDNPSPPPESPDSPIHKRLLGSGIVLVEYLCNLKQIRSTEITFLALPLRIGGADGSPARCLAYDGIVDFSQEEEGMNHA